MPKRDATYPAMTAEQQARDMLGRMGIEDAQRFTAGDLVELANLIADNAEQCRLLGMGSEREARLMARLAESQARGCRMREALRLCSGVLEEDGRDATVWLAKSALEIPSDDSALRELIEAARKEERDACAVICDELGQHYSDYKDTALLNGDVALSNAASGEPRAARSIAAAIRGRS